MQYERRGTGGAAGGRFYEVTRSIKSGKGGSSGRVLRMALVDMET